MEKQNLKKIANRYISANERFELLHTKLENGCWMWKGVATGSNGYGCISVDGKRMQAHRFSYAKHFGEIENGLFVLHKCDTPLCVNPNHLFLGTAKDNADDMVRKNRQAKGDSLSKAQKAVSNRKSNSKLKEEDVLYIFNNKKSQRKIAKDLNISQSTVSSIKKQRSWAWLTTAI